MVKRKKRSKGDVNSTGKMVLCAIKKLTRNTGWTSRTIIKFIKMEYKNCEPKLSRRVSRALKRGVELGLLQMEQGRYRLSKMSQIVRSVCTSKVRIPGKNPSLEPCDLRIQDSS